MIEIYSGIPRCGKTYNATRRAVELMEQGYKVYSNYPIIYKNYSSMVLEEDDLKTYTFKENSFLVIDEAQGWFESRKWKDFADGFQDMFSKHGHLAINMLLITQHPKRLDTIIRDCTALFWKFRKTSFYLPKFYIKENGNLGICIREVPICFRAIGFYEFDDYGKSVRFFFDNNLDLDVVKKFYWFSLKAQASYNTRYYASIFDNRKVIADRTWQDIIKNDSTQFIQ